MRHFPVTFAASTALAFALWLPTPAFAQDMGSNPITDFFDGLGFGEKEKPEIDYTERAPLVPPTNTAALPAPQAKGASRAGQQWPDDPDVAARAERRRRNNVVPSESYSQQMDRSPRVDPDELTSRRTAGASVPRNGGDGATRGDNEITRSSRDELSGPITRPAANSAPSGGRGRLTDPPPGYLQGNGVTVQARPEEKPWYAKMLGAN